MNETQTRVIVPEICVDCGGPHFTGFCMLDELEAELAKCTQVLEDSTSWPMGVSCVSWPSVSQFETAEIVETQTEPEPSIWPDVTYGLFVGCSAGLFVAGIVCKAIEAGIIRL